MLYAVASYFVLNTLLTYWIWGVEAGTIYMGEKDGIKVTLPLLASFFWSV